MKDSVENDEIVLDTSGTECPIPVLKARKLAQGSVAITFIIMPFFNP